jgi:hypothetical protein
MLVWRRQTIAQEGHVDHEPCLGWARVNWPCQSGADHTALISPIFCVRQRGLGFGALSNALQPVKAL